MIEPDSPVWTTWDNLGLTWVRQGICQGCSNIKLLGSFTVLSLKKLSLVDRACSQSSASSLLVGPLSDLCVFIFPSLQGSSRFGVVLATIGAACSLPGYGTALYGLWPREYWRRQIHRSTRGRAGAATLASFACHLSSVGGALQYLHWGSLSEGVDWQKHKKWLWGSSARYLGSNSCRYLCVCAGQQSKEMAPASSFVPRGIL